MFQSWKKWLVVGAGFGAGVALVLVSVFGAYHWYSFRPKPPKPWDANALRATYLDTGTENGDEGLVFFYRIQNTTAYDYRFPPSITRMSKDKEGVDLIDDFVVLDKEVVIPANSTVKIRVHYPGRMSADYFMSKRWETPESRKNLEIADIKDVRSLTKKEQLDLRLKYERDPAGYVREQMPELRGFVLLDQRTRYRIELPDGWAAK
jgi:hypothetical protein